MQIKNQIRRCWTNKAVGAILCDIPATNNILDIGQYRERNPKWRHPLLISIAPKDTDWYWEAKIKKAINDPLVTVWVIECGDGR